MSASASHWKRRLCAGRARSGCRPFLSTLCICIVFVPVFLLQGTAKYLFSPLSISVCVSLVASLVLSFTLVPVLFKYLMRPSTVRLVAWHVVPSGGGKWKAPFAAIHRGFERGFNLFR